MISSVTRIIKTNMALVALLSCVASAPIGRAYADAISEQQERIAEEEQIAADLANPLAPITTFSMQYRSEFGSGPVDDVNHQLRLLPSFFQPFRDTSAFLLRTALPVRFATFPQESSGLGDLSLSPYFVPDISTSTFLGFGGTLTFPTATEGALGAEKWSAGPALLLAEIGDPIVFGALMQHLWSYAGAENRREVNTLTAQPFVTYLLGGGFSATINSETVYDWNGSAGSRWVVPVAVALSKVVEIGDKYFNVGLGYVTYVERPTDASDAEFRLNVTYVMK